MSGLENNIAEPEPADEELNETEQILNIPDEPVPEPSLNPRMTKNGKVMPEQIEIVNKSKILPYITSQSPRKKHFKFINENDTTQLTKVLESIPELTVEYNTVRDKPYITLKKQDEVVGKIHFLYYNENTPEDKYVKLYLFDFVDPVLYSTVKDKIVEFFENFRPAGKLQEGGKNKKHSKKSQRTHKKKHNIRRKKTLRRNKHN